MEGGLKIRFGRDGSKFNVSIATAYEQWRPWGTTARRDPCGEEVKAGEMFASLPHTTAVALLLLLLSTCSEVLLSHGHLLLHVADLLLRPATVLLEEKTNKNEMCLNVCVRCINYLMSTV